MRSRNLDPATRRWILEDLSPMSRREVKEKEPWLLKPSVYQKAMAESLLFFYRCRWFDEVNRTCTNYENRPPPCREYPWPEGQPNPRAELPPTCSYREQINQPVHFRVKGLD